MLVLYYILAFVVGAVIGSFLNVCISRLPYDQSLLWPPGSRCGSCLRPIRALDNIPLLSYWLLGGKCRLCGASFSIRYFLVELFTALGFVALFHLEVVHNVFAFDREIGWGRANVQAGLIPWQAGVYVIHHAILLSLLIVVAMCDCQERAIPLGVTLFGTMLGLLSSMLWPWPWPYTEAQMLAGLRPGQPWWFGNHIALYPWPIWWPLPQWLPPGAWYTGLATGLAGMLAGSVFLRVIRFLFNKGLGASYLESRGGDALGLGDADLMMMAGSFLGWQPIIVAFFASVFFGLLLGFYQVVISRSYSLPFGPALAGGVVITWLGWGWLGPQVGPLFFTAPLLAILFVAAAFLLVVASLMLRAFRYLRAA